MSTDIDSGESSVLGIGSTLPSSLMDLLVTDSIEPGSDPSYQICKVIFTDHPLGLKMAQSPIKIAQSQQREIQIPGSPEKELQESFWAEWKNLKADRVIRNAATLSRVYGIASIAILVDGEDSKKPIDLVKTYHKPVHFNVLDPLNTAGSLVLNQDPNADSFLKPVQIKVGNKTYHSSRTAIITNEEPVYIRYTSSAFGFVGRSVYQRALYPLKTYVQSMITDQSVTEKAGLLVAKMKAPGSIIDQQSRRWFGLKRKSIKGARTGNVVSIGTEESIESVDLKNLRDAAEFARNNVLKNIATAADMPASMINQETLAEGFGEGSEDAKNIAKYIDGIRQDVQPLYDFMDNIVMSRAWNPDFYKSIQNKYPDEYGDIPYETAFYEWKNAFIAMWPNLLTEPDSEKIKSDEVVLKAAVAVYDSMTPNLDPENKASVSAWLADVINERRLLFDSHLFIDEQALQDYDPPVPEYQADSASRFKL